MRKPSLKVSLGLLVLGFVGMFVASPKGLGVDNYWWDTVAACSVVLAITMFVVIGRHLQLALDRWIRRDGS